MSRLSYCYILMEQKIFIFKHLEYISNMCNKYKYSHSFFFFLNPEDKIGYTKLKQPKTNKRNIMTI